MEPRLIQTQTQKLILTPQLRQYFQLLQLPLLQLRTTIEQELAENPVLEETAEEGLEEMAAPPEEKSKPETAAQELRFEETLRNLDKLDEEWHEGSYYSREDPTHSEIQERARFKDYQESLLTRKESLFDYLEWQIGLLELNEKDREIAGEITGNLTEDGYLDVPLEEIASNRKTTVDHVEGILKKVQALEPPGIAARDLRETLLLQIARKSPEADLPRRIVSDHLPLLERKRWEEIAKLTGARPESIQSAAKLIARLDPKPGRTFYAEDPIAVTPDAIVYFDDNDREKLIIEIPEEGLPEIRINPYYRRMLRNPKLDAESRRFLKEKLQAALDFVRALDQRKSTIRLITEALVKAQRPFFERGFAELNPLRLKDISAEIGLHESTVSRAIQGKYLSTPQGTLPYKNFFSSRLESSTGEAESQKSVMERIRDLIAKEESARPLSDQAITGVLQREGLQIARRTVAKYRELLKILPTHLRRQK